MNNVDPTGLVDLKRLIECTIGSEGINKQGCLDELSGQAKKEYSDAAKDLAADAADSIEQCATCVTVCTFKGFVGSTPEEMLANFGSQVAGRKSTAMISLVDEAAGASARGLLNRFTAVVGFLSTVECTLKCE